MSKYFQLEPEVPGELGRNTLINNLVFPPKIEKLEIVFKGWLGDCLIECFPTFLITERTSQKLIKNEMTGFSFKTAIIKKDYPFDELYPNLSLPKFIWIVINGTPKESDFGIDNNLLVVSEKALEILKSERLGNCDIVEI